jgi:hypothetical protein
MYFQRRSNGDLRPDEIDQAAMADSMTSGLSPNG